MIYPDFSKWSFSDLVALEAKIKPLADYDYMTGNTMIPTRSAEAERYNALLQYVYKEMAVRIQFLFVLEPNEINET